jgi:hypothetical protein
MRPKTILTVVILAFVAVSVGYLIVKEVRRAEAPEVAREGVSDPAPVETGGKEFEIARTETAAPLVAPPETETAAPATPPVSSDVASDEGPTRPAADRKIVVTYYYTTWRCASCLKIEAFSIEAIETGFGKELKAGKVVWRLVNVDEPANKHYVDDYQLYAKSVIVSELRGDEEVRWKNLAKVWQLTYDKNAFIKYVQDEVRDYLETG